MVITGEIVPDPVPGLSATCQLGVWNPYVPNCTIGKEVYVIDTLQEPQ